MTPRQFVKKAQEIAEHPIAPWRVVPHEDVGLVFVEFDTDVEDHWGIDPDITVVLANYQRLPPLDALLIQAILLQDLRDRGYRTSVSSGRNGHMTVTLTRENAMPGERPIKSTDKDELAATMQAWLWAVTEEGT